MLRPFLVCNMVNRLCCRLASPGLLNKLICACYGKARECRKTEKNDETELYAQL